MVYVPKFEDAQRVQCKASIMFEGLSGSGKSGTALLTGAILAGDDWKKVYATDTENRSLKLLVGTPCSNGNKYGSFKVAELTPDIGYAPSNYLAIKEAAVAAVKGTILDYASNAQATFLINSYDPTITLTPLHTIVSNDLGTNIDGLAFDYAGDLYVVNSSKEKFQKFTMPTPENICTVAAPSLEAIRFTPVYTVSVESNNNEWGIVSGGGTFEEGQNATITAVAATNYKFVNWTKDGAEVSTENPYTFAVTETATYTANFVEITKYTINATANDGEMGSVTGGGTYYEGSTATLTATPVGGYVFEKWSDDNTDNPRTITVSEAAAYTAIFKVAPARVFAYNLDVVDNGDDTYTLSFIPNANATSGRVILYNDDTKAQIHEAPIAGTIAKGMKSEVVVSKSVMPATGIVTWAVELTGETV